MTRGLASCGLRLAENRGNPQVPSRKPGVLSDAAIHLALLIQPLFRTSDISSVELPPPRSLAACGMRQTVLLRKSGESYGCRGPQPQCIAVGEPRYGG